MPLYGGDPYYSPDDITQELWTTLEFPAVQSFWQKWRLWLIGTAMVLGAATGTLSGLLIGHQYSPNPTEATTAPVPVHPVPMTIKTHPPTPAESRTAQ